MNKVVIITGGSRGIGRKLVKDFARDGYKVAFTYLTNEESSLKLKESLNNSGCQVICKKMDLAKDDDIISFVDFVMNTFGGIDVLVNSATSTNDSLFQDKTTKTFEDVLRVNLVGTFLLSKLVGDIMYKNKSGKIINISSTNGINTYFPMCLEYDASKAGINSLTHNLAMQFAPYVNVNAIAPGFIATESEIKDMDDEFIRSEEEKILLKRAGTEEDVSNLVLFLSGDKSNYINNQIIKINGGMYGD